MNQQIFTLALLTAVAVPLAAPAVEPRTGLEVFHKPNARWNTPQKEFAPYELPFRLPRKVSANVDYWSAPFYGVVLLRENNPVCDGGEYSTRMEKFRKQAQQRFPDRKVFADHQCPDMAAVSYNVGGQPSTVAMVAVYAGKTEAEGQAVLRKARTAYPKASLKRMRVIYNWIVQ